MSEIKVFVADDHALVREGVKAAVGSHPGMTVVGEAADGLTACECVSALRPDVVVADVSMPGLAGAQLTERLREECPSVKVLVLTFHEDRGCLRQLLAAGAAGYLLKQATAAEELVNAIRVVAAGGVYLNPILTGKVVGGFVRRPVGDHPTDGLSDRESGVAQLSAAGYANKEIAAQWDISVKTVETYRARAMAKLGLATRVELVRYAVRCGWFLDV